MSLDALPPELVLHLGGFLATGSLAALTRTARRYNKLLARQLYDPGFLGSWDTKRCRTRDTDHYIAYYPRWNCAQHWRSSYIVECFSKMPLEAMVFQAGDWAPWTWAHVFAFVGNLHLLKMVLGSGVKVDASLPEGETLLFLATMNEHLPVVQFLLKAGADMWVSDRLNRLVSPFEKAVDSKRVDLVLLFVEALKATNGDINQVGGRGETLLYRAIGCPRILALLLANGADPFAKSVFRACHRTALHEACRTQSAEECEILIMVMKDGNGSISIPDYDGETPLHFAALFGDCRGFMCKQLVKAGADLLARNSEGLNPMDMAVLLPNKPSFRVFLEYGPPIWPSEGLHKLLPSLVCYDSCLETTVHLVNTLVEARKVSFHWSMKDRAGFTALHYACRTIDPDDSQSFAWSLKNIDVLLENGADPDIPDEDFGETPLHAFLRGLCNEKYISDSAIRRLLHSSRNLAARTRSGDTLLHYATRHGLPQIIALLLRRLDRDTIFSTNDAGETILHTAASEERREQIVRQVLRAGLDVSTHNKEGRTALHIAAMFSNNLSAVRLLLDAGADVSSPDIFGNPPVHYAAVKRDDAVISYLVEAGASFHGVCGTGTCDEYITMCNDGKRKTNTSSGVDIGDEELTA